MIVRPPCIYRHGPQSLVCRARHNPSTLFDTSPRHHVYYRYEFPCPPRVRGHAQNRPQNAAPHLQFSYPLPYGAVLRDGGVQFVVYSRSATAMRVLLYERVTDREPQRLVEFNPEYRPLGRYLERLRSRPQSRPALPLPGRRARSTRPRATASIRTPGLIDPVRPRAGRPVPARRRRHHPPAQVRRRRRHVRLARRPPSQAARFRKRSSTRCTSAASRAAHPATSSSPARTPASSKRFRT